MNSNAVAKKSILKPKSKASTLSTTSNPLKSSASTPTKSLELGSKKKVEIVTPVSSVKSNEQVSTLVKETPLPRVAFLAPSPASRTKKSASKRSMSTAATSSSTKAPLKKTGKKLRKRKSKASKPAYVKPLRPPPDAGLQYIRELGTMNNILQSVADTKTHKGHEVELIEGVIRPFSVEELEQLLKSIGHVASLHRAIPGPYDTKPIPDVPTTLKGLIKGSSSTSKLKKAKKSDTDANEENADNPAASSTSLPSMTKAKKSKKSMRSLSVKAKVDTNNKRKSVTKKKGINPKTSSPGEPSGASKSIKSSALKSLYKPLKFKSGKSAKNKGSKKNAGKSKTDKKRSSDSVLSDLSELDLVKSAMLNKRFYEESMALERLKSNEELVQARRISGSRRRNRARDLRDEKRKSSKLSSAENGGVNLSPISSLISRSRSSSLKSVGSPGRESPHKLKTLEEALAQVNKTDDREEYKKAMNEVLINYSHVIRGPENNVTTYQQHYDDTKIQNKRFENPRKFPYKKEIDLDEVTGFDQHLQKIKYPGVPPMTQGLLEIKSTPKTLQERSEATGKYIRNERILEETRSNAESGSRVSKKEPPPKTRSAGKKAKLVKGNKSIRAQLLAMIPPKYKTKTETKEKAENKIDGAFSNVYQKAVPNPTATFEAVVPVVTEPTIENLAKAPSHWKDNSLVQSMSHGIGFDDPNRWATLNQRTVQQNREIKAKTFGRRRDVPKEDLDDVRRKLEHSDFADERKLYLEKMSKTRDAFDAYNTYYGHDKNKRPEAASYENPFDFN